MKTQIFDAVIIFVFILAIVAFALIPVELNMTEIETYSVGMEITNKSIEGIQKAQIFTLENGADPLRLEVNSDLYSKYNPGDVVEVLVTVKETGLFHFEYEFYTILGPVIID